MISWPTTPEISRSGSCNRTLPSATCKNFVPRLAASPTFDAWSLESLLRDFVDARGLGLKDIVHAVRVAVTGKSIGFGLFETLAILGRDRCLSRLDQAVKLAAARQAEEVK